MFSFFCMWCLPYLYHLPVWGVHSQLYVYTRFCFLKDGYIGSASTDITEISLSPHLYYPSVFHYVSLWFVTVDTVTQAFLITQQCVSAKNTYIWVLNTNDNSNLELNRRTELTLLWFTPSRMCRIDVSWSL